MRGIALLCGAWFGFVATPVPQAPHNVSYVTHEQCLKPHKPQSGKYPNSALPAHAHSGIHESLSTRSRSSDVASRATYGNNATTNSLSLSKACSEYSSPL